MRRCVLFAGAMIVAGGLAASPSALAALSDDPPPQEPVPWPRTEAATSVAPTPAAIPVALYITLVELDRQKLRAGDVNLNELLAANARSGRVYASPGAAKREESVVSPREAELFVKLLVSSGAGRVVAEPSLVTAADVTARFESGGLAEPATDSDSAGTRIEVTPQLQSERGELNLVVQLERITIDPTQSVALAGRRITSVSSRKIQAAIQVPSGRTAILHSSALDLVALVRPEIIPAADLRVRATRTAPPPRALPEVAGAPSAPDESIHLHAGASMSMGFPRDIVQVRVDNPGVVAAHPVSSREVRLVARQAGSTTVNLYTSDRDTTQLSITVHPPHPVPWGATAGAEPLPLEKVLSQLFPDADIQVVPLVSSAVIRGVVEARQISTVVQIAEDYYPRVINQLAARDAPTHSVPVAPDPYASRSPAAENGQAVGREIRALREEVERLRGDVRRLIERLEADTTGAVPSVNDPGPAGPAAADVENAVTPAEDERLSVWKLDLDQAVRLALENSPVTRAHTDSARDDVSPRERRQAAARLAREVEDAFANAHAAWIQCTAARQARDGALVAWRGTSDDRAARERYFGFRSRLEVARQALDRHEQRLRFLMGLPAADGRIILPAELPAACGSAVS